MRTELEVDVVLAPHEIGEMVWSDYDADDQEMLLRDFAYRFKGSEGVMQMYAIADALKNYDGGSRVGEVVRMLETMIGFLKEG